MGRRRGYGRRYYGGDCYIFAALVKGIEIQEKEKAAKIKAESALTQEERDSRDAENERRINADREKWIRFKAAFYRQQWIRDRVASSYELWMEDKFAFCSFGIIILITFFFMFIHSESKSGLPINSNGTLQSRVVARK